MHRTHSVWRDDAPPPSPYEPPPLPPSCDVAIVGGGISGITAAYLLAKAGKKVVLFEKNDIGGGESGQTTAFLSYVSDADLSDLISTFGEKRAPEIWHSLQAAINTIEAIVAEEHIACEFRRCPLVYYSEDNDGAKHIREEYTHAHAYGFPVHRYDHHLLEHSTAEIRYDEHGVFHPIKYLHRLTEKIRLYGGMIFDQTFVNSYHHSKKHVTLNTSAGTIEASDAIIATHNPNLLTIPIQSRMIPKQTYVIAATVPHGSIPHMLFIDTTDPYHYIRVDRYPDYDRVLIGGEDHVTGKEPTDHHPYKKLEAYFTHLFPRIPYTVTHAWSGEVFESLDGIPFITRLSAPSHHLHVSTGYAGDGMTFGTLSAMIHTDNILGKDNPWSELYSSHRTKEVKEIVRHNIEVAHDFIAGRFEKDDTPIEHLDPDTGTVIHKHGTPRAIYKKTDGQVCALSAVCTHAGCTVAWNSHEKTWDCPCHGSRFLPDGTVLSGPAARPLEKLDDIT